MRNKASVLAALTAAFLMTTPVLSQSDYYDLTEHFLMNASFDSAPNYDAAANTDVKNTIGNVESWTLTANSKKMLCVGATFQYGSAATVYGLPLPQGPNGQQGACLVVSASLKNELTFAQSFRLLPGNYRFIVCWQNFNSSATGAQSTCGWMAASKDGVLSQRTEFEAGQWINDTIDFTLTTLTTGQLQVGMKSAGGQPTASAMLAIDHVKLLRDTPFSDDDEALLCPSVTTDNRFARGATMAFGRLKVNDNATMAEEGFCWATYPNPTIADNHTTEHLNNNGNIYWMKDLTPATIYYMRAYAKSNEGRVGYGDVIKFSTLPKGDVTYWYNNGGPADANDRVNAAAANACDIFSNLTSIKKHFNIGYSAGTPTADCYYADEPWMNMGANASYQRTGTIMHEMQHGMGVIPYTTQWSKNILRERLDGDGRGTGHWLGDRVTELLRFWDNNNNTTLNGDYQHLWPYGINGASEDNGSLELYYMNAMIGQALGEDGLEHRYNTFAEPYYSLTQDDDTKYYLTCEREDRGRFTAYLMPTPSNTLRYVSMTAEEAMQNDSTAWYITFTPRNQYYQLRNAATGQYMTYSGSIRTAAHSNPTASDNFHLMPGRVKVKQGDSTLKGYWIIHPWGDNWTPPCLSAANTGMVVTNSFNIANTANMQRWIILTAEEMKSYDRTGIEAPMVDTPQDGTTSRAIYSLDGRFMGTDASGLKKGIYIVNGRKAIIH